MPPPLPSDSVILRAINQGLQAEGEKMITAIVESAKADLETQLRAKLAGVCLNLTRHMSMQTLRDEIVITIRIPESR